MQAGSNLAPSLLHSFNKCSFCRLAMPLPFNQPGPRFYLRPSRADPSGSFKLSHSTMFAAALGGLDPVGLKTWKVSSEAETQILHPRYRSAFKIFWSSPTDYKGPTPALLAEGTQLI